MGVLRAQEYEYIRFDALAWLARRLRRAFALPSGRRSHAFWIEAIARQLSLRACRGLIVASSAERVRVSQGLSAHCGSTSRISEPAQYQGMAGDGPPGGANKPSACRGIASLSLNHGRIDIRRKGLDVLLKAWAHFADDSSSQLMIIGSGQDSEAFAKLLRESGLSNVRWLSSYTTDRPLIRRWLSAADAYVTASRIEGMPVAPLEAMACGLPVIATDAQGLPDIMADGEASGGLMVGQERPEEIAQALARLKDDSALRARLGAAGRNRVTEKFSIEAVGASLDDFLTMTRK